MALDRATVVAAGLDLLDEVGLDDLTLRRLAERLGVKAPAIYWHVRDKQQLLDEMATEMMRAALPTGVTRIETLGWADLLTAMAQGLRHALGSRRDGGKLFGGSYATDAGVLSGIEPVLARLVECGFGLAAAVQATRTVFCFVLGFVIEEQGTAGRESLFDPTARRERIDEKVYPLSAEAGRYMFGDFDALFAAGVRVIVAGVDKGFRPGGGDG